MKKLNLIKKMMLVASTAFMATSLVFVPSVQNKEAKVNKNKSFNQKNDVQKKTVDKSSEITMELIALDDIEQPMTHGKPIWFQVNASEIISWSDKDTGAKLVVTDEQGQNFDYDDTLIFSWDDPRPNVSRKFKIISRKKQHVLKKLNIKIVKIDDPSIYTETKTIKLFDGEAITLTLDTTADLSQPIARNQSIEFTLGASKPFSWKDTYNGAQLVLTTNEGSSIEIDSYFDFAWDESSISEISARFTLTSNKINEVLTSVKLKVVKRDEPSIETTTKTIKLFDEKKLTLKLETSYSGQRVIQKGQSVNFSVRANKAFNWNDESSGAFFYIYNFTESKQESLDKYFDFEWQTIQPDIATFTITSKKENNKLIEFFLKVRKKDDHSIYATSKRLKLYDVELTLDLVPLNDLSEPIAKDQSIKFALTATKDFNWKDEVSGAKFVLTNSEDNEINLEDYFTFAWDDSSISSQTAEFTLRSIAEHKELTSVKLKVVKADNEIISTETKTIKLFDQPEPKLRITLSSEYDFSRKLAKDESIVFKLDATKDVDWKNSSTGVVFDLTDAGGDKVNVNDYFDFKWDKEMNNTTAQFTLTSKNKQFTEKALTLKVVKIDDPSIETTTKTIKLFDEVEPEPKVVLNLLTDFDLEKNVKKDDVIEFTLTATKDFNWKDEVSGAKFVLLDNGGHEINLEDCFSFAWVEESISPQTAKFTLKSKVEHKELTSVNLKVVKKDDKSISTETKTIKLFDPEPTPGDKTSNSNNLIIIGASTGAGALVASTATGVIISKKRKRSKQL